MTPPKNSKTFNLIVRTSETFDLIIENFAYAATLLFRIRNKIRITFSPQFFLVMYSTINLRRIRVLISQMKLITSLTQVINLRRVRIILSIKERIKFVSTVYGRVRLSVSSKAIQKVITSIIIKKVSFTMIPILATFYTLGDYDPQILGDLDSLTLGEMDYST